MFLRGGGEYGLREVGRERREIVREGKEGKERIHMRREGGKGRESFYHGWRHGGERKHTKYTRIENWRERII